MSDLNETLAQEAAELINGGEWRDGKWYSDGHRDAWRRALKPAADRIEKLEAALNCNLPDYDLKIGVVERLRQLGNWRVDGTKSSPIYNKSADHIEKLEAALREIAYTEPEDKYWPGRIARKALEGKDD